jgi:hypothetical protein
MTEKNLRKKVLAELTLQWKNGAGFWILQSIIKDYAREVNPKMSSYGYSSRLNPEEWDDLVGSLQQKTYHSLNEELGEYIYKTLKKKYERARAPKRRLMTNDEIEADIGNRSITADVRERLLALLDVWDAIDGAAPTIALAVEDMKTDLGKFIKDRQNVHTRVVNRQTNAIMSELAKQPVKKKQKTMDEIMEIWQAKYTWDTIQPIYKDMTYWANVSEVEKEDDWAYRVALRALWAKIKTYETETRDELTKRLFEECQDSVGMCAQGHLTRLANVLVGFDGSVAPQKESLQDRMVAISLLELDTELKIVQATKIMDEMNIPKEKQTAWLEAF